MAQDISGTPLAIAAAQTARQVAYAVYVDFNDVGFSVYPTGWTDVTEFVKRLTGDHQATDWRKSIAVVGSGVADEVTVTLRNPEETSPYSGLRYSASNVYSSLYDEIGDGLINMKRAVVEMGFTYLGSDYRVRQITGYITGFNDNRRGRDVTFTIRDRAAAATQARVTSGLYRNQTAGTYMATLAALLDIDPPSSSEQVLDNGMIIMPYAWLDDDAIWEEMSTVAEAQLGRIWFDKDGCLHFEDGSHFVKPADNSYDDPTTSQFSFTAGNVQSVDARYDMPSIFNHIIVEYQPRYLATQQTIYNATETTVIPPEGNRTVTCEFRYPVQDLPWWEEGGPMTELDVTVSACTGGGIDITDDISLQVATYATKAVIRLANGNENFAAYVYQLDIDGQPLLSEQADSYEVEDSTSIGRYGRRTWTVHNPYIVQYRHAQTVADYLLSRYKDPIQVVRIAGARGVPWLEPGDRVTVTDSLSGIDDDYFLTHIRWSFAPNAAYTMDCTAMRASDLFPYSDYFIVGTDYYGYPTTPTSTSSIYGRMFW